MRFHALILSALVVTTVSVEAARRRPTVKPSSVHLVGEDFHAKVPPGWFNLERLELEESRATDRAMKRQLNMLIANYRMAKADGSEIMVAGMGDRQALITVSQIPEVEIEKSKIGNDEYCKKLGRKIVQAPQKLDYARSMITSVGVKTCSIGSSTSSGRKYAGVIMLGRSNTYLVMSTVEKGVELPSESLQAFVDTWYLK